MKFRATVIPSGNATAVELPTEVVTALGAAARPPIAITINGYTWRSRVAAMRGQRLVGISRAQREACGIAEGDTVEVDLELDTEPRVVPDRRISRRRWTASQSPGRRSTACPSA